MSIKVKVCGMRAPENIKELAVLNPDYMGFIFYERSPRFVGKEFIIPAIPKTIKRVGVFVNESDNNINGIIKHHKLDAVQLHGAEPPAFCALIRSQGVEVIKSFGIDELFDFSILKPFETCCDYFLFDTRSYHWGGSGQHFNWDKLDSYEHSKPFVLSGGISLEDIPAIKTVASKRPLHAVDLNSRFELDPGIKKMDDVEKFIKTINA